LETRDVSGGDSFADLKERLQSGDSRAGSEVFRRYSERLVRLAAPRLTGLLRQKTDPEEIVQSAFRSFFRAHGEKSFVLGNWNDLWSVLVTITLRKCRYQVRQFLTAKRDIRVEQSADVADWSAVASEPTPAEAAEFADLLMRLFDGLDARARQIVELSLESYSPAEIGPRVGLTERSVYRQMERIRSRLVALDAVADGP
jgi:RNA polymerase sigma-70 factor (ECF subfamily)